MKQRLLTAVVGFAVLTPILIFSDTLVFPIAVAIFAALGAYELLGCIGQKQPAILLPSVLIAAAFPMIARCLTAHTGEIILSLLIISVIVYVYLFYLFCTAVLSKGKYKVDVVATVFAAVVYTAVGFAAMIFLRDVPCGEYLYLMVFVGAWVTDGAAYFVGRSLGKHKLIPDVSPKKTVEGAIGGTVFGALSFPLFGLIIHLLTGREPAYLLLLLIGLVISLISQLGDLIASLIKRHYGIKDYGNLFPGHGGVMDRFDSIIAIAPFFFILCVFIGSETLFI